MRVVAERSSVLIVGGGSAGCVLARRLSENPDRSVLVIEAGCRYPPEQYPADLIAGSIIAVEPHRTWGYLSVPGRVGHSIAAYAGRVLGGGSAINAGIARRARPSDFARWVRRGLPEWSFDRALEAYKALENTPHGEDRWHGRSGLWPVRQSKVDELTPPVKAFVEAASTLGFDRIDDFNGEQQNGVGGEVKNIVDGVRYNTGMIYLSSEIRERPNLTIRSNAMVDRLVLEGTRATGVRLVTGEVLEADEIVLSAGVYGSPAILLRSGIGPAPHLLGLGIKPLAHLPVGDRLQDQPMYVLVYVVKPDAGAYPASGSGLLWTQSSEAIDDELDLQLSISVQPDLNALGTPIRTLRIWATVVTPRSTGTLRLKSADPLASPRIDYNLLGDLADRRRLSEAVTLAREIIRHDPVAALIESELAPGEQVRTQNELAAAIDAGLLTFYHGVGTCPMGGDGDRSAVVNAWGQVRGIDSLRIVDASIFPQAISAPINLTTIMVAERIATVMTSNAPV